MPPEGLTFRIGDLADFDKIMELNVSVGFLKGLDYLPGVYRYWLHSKRYQVFVVEHSGKIVGMFGYHAFPMAEYVATVGARVHPDFRRTGTKGFLYELGVTSMFAHCPKAQYLVFDALKNDYWTNLLKISKGAISLERKWLMHIHKSVPRKSVEDFVLAHSNSDIAAVQRLQVDTISKADVNKDIQDRIRLEGEFFTPSHGWLSLKVSDESVRQAACLGSVHASYKTESQLQGQMVGVSFSSSMLTGEELIRVDINYYGEDTGHFLSHVATNLQHTLSVTRFDTISILIRQPFRVDTTKASAHLSEWLGSREDISGQDDPPVAYLIKATPEFAAKL